MTTSRTTFVPFCDPPLIQRHPTAGSRLAFASIALALGPLTSPIAFAGAWTGPASQAQIVRLPPENRPTVFGVDESFDGHHIRWSNDDRELNELTLGPAVPSRTLISAIEQRIAQDGGRDAGISVENLGSVLLVRGTPATAADALSRAAATAEETIAEFRGLTETLEFRASVSLVASGEGADDVAVIQAVRTIAAGQREAFGERTERSFVGDFDVEVATDQSIADPVIASVETGETLHLWASTTLRQDGLRQLHVQGLLDVAIEAGSSRFDPNVYELGSVEQPIVRTVQLMFAGTVPEDGPLVVTLEGLPGELPMRRLEISAVPSQATQQAAVNPTAVVDLSRGIWRGSLGQHHALADRGSELPLPEGRMPASAAQLMALNFASQRLPRPDLGSAALFLAGVGAPGASSSFPAVQALFRSIDPTGPTMTLEVGSDSGDFRASMPATLGALIRVARTQETVLVLDYAPQIANEATLADPSSEIVLYGEVMEGVLELSGGQPQLVGSVTRQALLGIETREVDPLDVGRIQQPKTLRSSATILIQGGGNASAAGLKLSLK